MGFEIYLAAYRDHEPFAYDIAIVEDLLGPLIADRHSFGWDLKGGGCVHIAEQPTISHFCIDRPQSSDIFFDALVEIMRRTGSVLYWPDEGRIACVADPAVIAHLPPDMLEVLGEPYIVSKGEDVLRAIRGR